MGMTYQSLSTQISAWLDNTSDSFVAQIPNFISNAQARICRDCPLVGFEQYSVATMIAGNNIIPKPARWRYTTHFDIREAGIAPPSFNQKLLYERPLEYCMLYSPDPTVTAQPQFYADEGFYNWFLAPTPDLAYPFRVGYIELVEPITLLIQTNWLTDYIPDILLYACLLETATFLRTDERIPVWTSEYKTRTAALNAQNEARYQDRSSKRNVS
jgi:hypothetical protein